MYAKFDAKSFTKMMDNIIQYSEGFLEGAQLGKRKLMENIGRNAIDAMKEYVDSSARVNPEALQHVYEWYQSGNPNARLFDLYYTVSNLGLSFRSSFRQSVTVARGSTTPFYDKARIMEEGIPVTIKPKKAKALAFDVDGEQVFVRGNVTVSNPGGSLAEGSLERTLEEFIALYFTQAFMNSSSLGRHLSDPTIYKKNLASGSRLGKAKGVETGYRWIANADMEAA